MKQQDIAIIIIIVFFAGIASYIVSNKFFSASQERREAETVTEISTIFTPPSDKYYNANSINPTRRIEIAPTNNNQPFKDSEQ